MPCNIIRPASFIGSMRIKRKDAGAPEKMRHFLVMRELKYTCRRILGVEPQTLIHKQDFGALLECS